MEISLNDINSYQLPSNCFQSHYKIIEYLGEGSFGKVFKAREISTGRILAVKKMSINHSEKKYSNIIKEINLLKHLDHPNIVKYYDYFEEEDYIYLMMEYLEGGTLRQYMKEKTSITEDDARIIIKQLLTALSYLHYTCDICHRDVKPENIMFSNKDDITGLKLLDFGLSSDRFESKNYLENCGTLIYMAPEQINKMIYSKAVDVWSVGIILYMLLNKGKNPFYNKGESQEVIIQNITNNNIVYSNDCLISEMGKHLINKLLKKNSSYRYTIRSALDHPWVTLNKFDKIPMTIYDKAFFDEYSDKLKTLLLASIFFLNQKNNYVEVSKNNNKKNKLNTKIGKERSKKASKSNLYDYFYINENKKETKRKNSENSLKIFNMNEYEQLVKNSNLLYHQKFKEDRETMFNPQINTNNNELLLSALMKRISEKQKTRQSSFLLENKTNINLYKNKYESINSLDNESHMNGQKLKMNIMRRDTKKKISIFADEQKNSEQEFNQEDLSKMETPYKLKKNNLLEKNKNNISDNKSKLMRRFSAMPKMRKNSIYKMNYETNKICKLYKEEKKTGLKRQNKTSPLNNYINFSKKENEIKNRNDMNIFKKQMDLKKSKFKNKSVKDGNSYFHIDRSMLINDKEKKWNLNYKNIKNHNNFPFLKNKKEKYEKNLFDANIFSNNEINDYNYLNNEKNSKLLSFTEQSQKNHSKQLFNKRLPKLSYNKYRINN